MATPCFGIDLGTTCSTIGYVDRGRPRLLSLDGADLVPSVVSYVPGEAPRVGREALNRLVLDPERTIRSSKRLMGSYHAWQIDGRSITPADVGAEVLRYLCAGAERVWGMRPERVVITTPAWFTQAQRADTRRAGEMARLEVVRLLNEPTAAALAHAHGHERTRRLLVYDLGGGTFDISLVEQDGALLEVKASHGDSLLGGDDFDRGITENLLQRLRIDDPALLSAIEQSPAARTKLVMAVEAAKMELSQSLRTMLRIPFLVEVHGEPRHLEAELSREDVEVVVEPYLDKTLRLLGETVRDAQASYEEIDELVLVGGSSRIPLVWHRLREETGLEGSAAIAPDRVVGLGAAIQAAIVDGSRVDGILVDIAPFSLSVGVVSGLTLGNYVSRVITPRNAPLPARHCEVMQTMHPMQSELRVEVFQGSKVNPLHNALLGVIDLKNLPNAPEGEFTRPIDVEFVHDLDGMVNIRVTDRLSGKESRGQVAADGKETNELRAALVKQLKDDSLIPGDGSDPDPFGSDAEEVQPATKTLAPARISETAMAITTTDLEEASSAFARVQGNAAKLIKDHAGSAQKLSELVNAGLAAVAADRTDEALRIYDELSDLLFANGIYL